MMTARLDIDAVSDTLVDFVDAASRDPRVASPAALAIVACCRVMRDATDDAVAPVQPAGQGNSTSRAVRT